MSSSARTRRMARNHRRIQRPAKLNLVALMDIFTILVLFLIVNNGDVEVLQTHNEITLPDSVAEQRPEPAMVIALTDSAILLNDRHAVDIDQALATANDVIPDLAAALRSATNDNPLDADSSRRIIIMGDQHSPFALLKRVMATCAETHYTDISLAVNHAPLSGQDSTIAMAGAGP